MQVTSRHKLTVLVCYLESPEWQRILGCRIHFNSFTVQQTSVDPTRAGSVPTDLHSTVNQRMPRA